jgi:hypothetical protein
MNPSTEQTFNHPRTQATSSENLRGFATSEQWRQKKENAPMDKNQTEHLILLYHTQ